MRESLEALCFGAPSRHATAKVFVAAMKRLVPELPGVFLHAELSNSQDVTVIVRLQDGRNCVIGIQCKDTAKALKAGKVEAEGAKMCLTPAETGKVYVRKVVMCSSPPAKRTQSRNGTVQLSRRDMVELLGEELLRALQVSKNPLNVRSAFMMKPLPRPPARRCGRSTK